jgi:hypothetical protein
MSGDLTVTTLAPGTTFPITFQDFRTAVLNDAQTFSGPTTINVFCRDDTGSSINATAVLRATLVGGIN